jgi:hypothetical protein
MSPDMVLALPTTLWIALIFFGTLIAGLIFYALYRKGDVFAEFSHGLTTFRLEARDRDASESAGARSKSKNALPRP